MLWQPSSMMSSQKNVPKSFSNIDNSFLQKFKGTIWNWLCFNFIRRCILIHNIFIDLAIVSIDTRWHFFMNTMKIPREELISAIRLVRLIFASMAIFTKLQYFYRTPLFPIVADLVMRDLEALKLQIFNSCFIFVISTTLLWQFQKNIVNLHLRTFNLLHNKLKFTLEFGDDRKNFLDIIIINNNYHYQQ